MHRLQAHHQWEKVQQEACMRHEEDSGHKEERVQDITWIMMPKKTKMSVRRHQNIHTKEQQCTQRIAQTFKSLALYLILRRTCEAYNI